jgi:four helix bundle protein
MATIKRFEDLLIWQKARELCSDIHKIVTKSDFRDYELRRQITGSSGSVMDNPAEGFERGSTKEFIQFLGFAKGSGGEVKSQLYRLLDTGAIDKITFDKLYDKADALNNMVGSFIEYLKKTDIKGKRFSNKEKKD